MHGATRRSCSTRCRYFALSRQKPRDVHVRERRPPPPEKNDPPASGGPDRTTDQIRIVGARTGLTTNVLILSFATDRLHDQKSGLGHALSASTTLSVEKEQHGQSCASDNNMPVTGINHELCVFVGSSDNAGNAISECDVSERTDTGVTAPRVFSLGGNAYDSSASCPFLAASDPVVTPQQIRLAPLGHYGGPTATAAPMAGSALIDAATGCLDASGVTITQDQRGVSRPQGMQCDIGAVESNNDLIFIDAFGG